jgi:hypothetical protein
VKYWQTTLAILGALFASIALADDFKTIDGKEYKNVTVSRIEPDGILLRTKSGIAKVYFVELPKEVQERFHYDPEKAAAAQAAAVQQAEATNKQAEELDRRRKDAYKEQQRQQGQLAEQQAKQQNVQALVDRLAELQQQEENLLVEIGRAESEQTVARRNWIDGRNQPYTDPKEAGLPLLRGRLDNVRDEKRRVQRQLEQAQRQQ